MSTRVQTGLKQSVVLLHETLIQHIVDQIVVDQALPWYGETEDVESILVGKMLHLAGRHVQARAFIFAIVAVFRSIISLLMA